MCFLPIGFLWVWVVSDVGMLNLLGINIFSLLDLVFGT